MGPRLCPGWQQWWKRRGRGSARSPPDLGFRHGWLDPTTRSPLRSGRDETHLRDGLALRTCRLCLFAGSNRPLFTNRGRRRTPPPNHFGARPPRLHKLPCRGSRLPSGSCRKAGPIEARVAQGILWRGDRRGSPKTSGRSDSILSGRWSRDHRDFSAQDRSLDPRLLPNRNSRGFLEPGSLRRHTLHPSQRPGRKRDRRLCKEPGRRIR